MNRLLLVACMVSLLLGCSTTTMPVRKVVDDAEKWDKKYVTVNGYLCVEPFTVYLSSSIQCDELQEEKTNEFKIYLWLDSDLMRKARTISNGSRVEVAGEFDGPPSGTIRETTGELAGFSIRVTALSQIR